MYWQHHARLGAPSLVHDMHDLGYSMSGRTVGRMLKKLGLRSKIARQGYPIGVMIHSDQGSQYCSRDFRSALLTNRAIQSMSRRGNCWDNAVIESFFDTLKGHVVHDSVFSTRKEANSVLFEYIEVYYNRVRRHSANDWLSPEAFEQKYFKNLEGSTVHQSV
jgi:transposase InsO family protein